MFRPLLGHLQALWENRSKRYLYFNALWDPKCLQIVLYDTVVYPGILFGDSTNSVEDREKGDLGAVGPSQGFWRQL